MAVTVLFRRYAFEDVARFLLPLRSIAPLWAQLRVWRDLFWLSLHYDHATVRGGVVQQRRTAHYQAKELLPNVLFRVAHAQGVPLDSEIDAIVDSVLKSHNAGTPVAPPGRVDHAFTEPMLSPARSIKIPMVVLRDSSFRPRKLSLTLKERCVTCRTWIHAGEVAYWSRAVGVAHLTCRWPDTDKLLARY